MEQCASCTKTPGPGESLKRCAKCQTVRYCSRDCQKADWKQHKKTCAANASTRNAASSTSNQRDARSNTSSNTRTSTHNSISPFTKSFHALNDKKWLHNRPEADVYKLLINTYRLRLEDDYKFSGDVDVDSIYGGAPNGYKGFNRFLGKIEAKNRALLPSWWSKEKAEECEKLGRRNGRSSLSSTIEKGDIVEHYGDPLMPMQLRMFGEQVYGTGPGGQPGAAMMQVQMMAESGTMASSHIDASRFR
jgi:mitochondrial splicing suppressor protein 51